MQAQGHLSPVLGAGCPAVPAMLQALVGPGSLMRARHRAFQLQERAGQGRYSHNRTLKNNIDLTSLTGNSNASEA
jgi:hypothetical protein